MSLIDPGLTFYLFKYIYIYDISVILLISIFCSYVIRTYEKKIQILKLMNNNSTLCI